MVADRIKFYNVGIGECTPADKRKKAGNPMGAGPFVRETRFS